MRLLFALPLAIIILTICGPVTSPTPPPNLCANVRCDNYCQSGTEYIGGACNNSTGVCGYSGQRICDRGCNSAGTACEAASTPTPTATPTATPTPSQTSTPTPTPTQTATSTPTPSQTPAPSISCGIVITSPGRYALNGDLAAPNNHTNCIAITAGGSGTTIDCAGHRIVGKNLSAIGIHIDSASNVTVLNCLVSNFNVGVSLRGTSGAVLRNNRLTDNLEGISITNNGRDSRIEDNELSGNGNGVKISDGSKNVFLGNDVNNNRNYGFYLVPGNNNTFTGNTVMLNSHGFYLQNANYNEITNNNVTANRQYGIYLNYAQGNRFSGNNLHNAGTDFFCSTFNPNIDAGNVCSSKGDQCNNWVVSC